jgi:hypothetical protein
LSAVAPVVRASETVIACVVLTTHVQIATRVKLAALACACNVHVCATPEFVGVLSVSEESATMPIATSTSPAVAEMLADVLGVVVVVHVPSNSATYVGAAMRTYPVGDWFSVRPRIVESVSSPAWRSALPLTT